VNGEGFSRHSIGLNSNSIGGTEYFDTEVLWYNRKVAYVQVLDEEFTLSDLFI
jgi:hypothetical protein